MRLPKMEEKEKTMKKMPKKRDMLDSALSFLPVSKAE